MDKGSKAKCLSWWRSELAAYYREVRGKFAYFLFYNRSLPHEKFSWEITKLWLRKQGIEYDRIFIERGDDNTEDSQGHYNNRFYISRKNKIKFFIEDDYLKAKKLSFICDIVFLIKHPYNESKTLPNNVILVNSWGELDKKIREFM
jgi:uncharacterized HAD superfamily protein